MSQAPRPTKQRKRKTSTTTSTVPAKVTVNPTVDSNNGTDKESPTLQSSESQDKSSSRATTKRQYSTGASRPRTSGSKTPSYNSLARYKVALVNELKSAEVNPERQLAIHIELKRPEVVSIPVLSYAELRRLGD